MGIPALININVKITKIKQLSNELDLVSLIELTYKVLIISTSSSSTNSKLAFFTISFLPKE